MKEAAFKEKIGVVGRLLSLGFTRAWMLVLPAHLFELSKLTGLDYSAKFLRGFCVNAVIVPSSFRAKTARMAPFS